MRTAHSVVVGAVSPANIGAGCTAEGCAVNPAMTGACHCNVFSSCPNASQGPVVHFPWSQHSDRLRPVHGGCRPVLLLGAADTRPSTRCYVWHVTDGMLPVCAGCSSLCTLTGQVMGILAKARKETWHGPLPFCQKLAKAAGCNFFGRTCLALVRSLIVQRLLARMLSLFKHTNACICRMQAL